MTHTDGGKGSVPMPHVPRQVNRLVINVCRAVYRATDVIHVVSTFIFVTILSFFTHVPCRSAKCVQRKIRCTFVKFHRQTAPIGPGHNQSRSGNPSGSTSHHPSPRQQQPPTFNPAVGNAYGPVYGSYDSSVGNLGYPAHHATEDDPFVLQPAPESSYATNYRAQQSELHRRASLPSFSASAQPWISGWHENTANGEGGPIPFNVDAGHHFAFEVGGDYRVS